ncbi:divalent-cation tolerance protein CutA [Cyanobium sp. Cruz CV13-4-11]|jgi:periplasmic divalent cation tolerance protein|uniref:divalent-cation tolerance protein CutA n=1 Tax=unclassified Cyanobium TaxID=2627006 RepID=UPI0020CC6E40|nr:MULTISPECIES: divalent-cation tolerance protein CutA [unclassified Cyanobium]MCP9899933.1 divalent-cation tolerance protein CutA [Cyanobium sp. Cruz CV11-17]MCP9918964.1 divalent-cation tolerance protein CutA [Cyanobium sp. Cruz CV13-4-11]
MPETDPIPVSLVLTTEADRKRAEALALALLERGLVACASLHPVESLYRWQGQLERSEEVQLLLKTSPGKLEELRRNLGELHSYDTPEWIHWQASSDGPYGRWLLEQLPLSPGGGPPTPAMKPGDADPAG